MPSEHARLGPSAAERWMACPASVRMSAEVLGYSDSSYAREGTLAHTRAEIEAGFLLGHFGLGPRSQRIAAWRKECDAEGLTTEQRDDIEYHAKNYALFLVAKRDEMGPGTFVLLEERVYPGVPQSFGTGDAVLVSPIKVCVVDFKYGSGVAVEVYENPQLKLYGTGALEGFGDVVDTTEEVELVIFQPRVREDPIACSYTPQELRNWRDLVVIPVAELALSDDAPFNPGEVQCRWCPAAGICRPRMDAATAQDFSTDPDVLSDDDLDDAMQRIPEMRAWANAVEKIVFRKVHDLGQPVGGWKVVKTEGNRKITDGPAAIEKLVAAGYPLEKVQRTQPETLGNLEKLVGKTKLPPLLGDLLQKGEGSKALVPEDDPRPPFDPNQSAAADFAEEAS